MKVARRRKQRGATDGEFDRSRQSERIDRVFILSLISLIIKYISLLIPGLFESFAITSYINISHQIMSHHPETYFYINNKSI